MLHQLVCLLQMIYDGEGSVVRWILVTEGTLVTYEMLEQYDIDVLLLKSNDGGLSSTVLRNAMITIKRYLQLTE